MTQDNKVQSHIQHTNTTHNIAIIIDCNICSLYIKQIIRQNSHGTSLAYLGTIFLGFFGSDILMLCAISMSVQWKDLSKCIYTQK